LKGGRVSIPRGNCAEGASKKRFQSEPDWAVPVLGRLLEKGLVEADSMAHYRLTPDSKRESQSAGSRRNLKKSRTHRQGFQRGAEIKPPETPQKTDDTSGAQRRMRVRWD